jgi:hypothetical protein
LKDGDGNLKSLLELQHIVKVDARKRFFSVTTTGDLNPFSEEAFGVD